MLSLLSRVWPQGLYLEQAILIHLFDCRFVASLTHSILFIFGGTDKAPDLMQYVLLRVTTKSSLIVLRLAQYTCDKTVTWLYSWIRSTIEETKEMSPLQLVIHMVQDCNAEEQEIHLDKTNKRQSVTACGYCFSFVEYIAVQKGMYNPKKEKKRHAEGKSKGT